MCNNNLKYLSVMVLLKKYIECLYHRFTLYHWGTIINLLN